MPALPPEASQSKARRRLAIVLANDIDSDTTFSIISSRRHEASPTTALVRNSLENGIAVYEWCGEESEMTLAMQEREKRTTSFCLRWKIGQGCRRLMKRQVRRVNVADSSSAPDDTCSVVVFEEISPNEHTMTVTICRQRDQLKWMAEVPDDRRLTSMSIAGTHESFALHGFPISACQSSSLADQFNLGIRFIDLRFSIKRGRLVGYHGIQNQYVRIEQALSSIYDFLGSNPSETVVVSIKQEDAAPNFEALVLDALALRSEFWYLEDRWPTLGEVRGRAVLFCRFGHSNGKGLHPNTWPDSRSVPWVVEIGGERVKVQDWYEIGSYRSIPKKVDLVSSLFASHSSTSPPLSDVANESLPRTINEGILIRDGIFPPPTMPLVINYASASSFITAFPFLVAKGSKALRVKGVNKRLIFVLLDLMRHSAARTRGRPESGGGAEGGMFLLLDFCESEVGLVELMLARNFTEFHSVAN